MCIILLHRAVREALGGNKRSLVLTRSTYPGTGSYSGRWLGDNNSNWPDLRYSIIGKKQETFITEQTYRIVSFVTEFNYVSTRDKEHHI